GGNGAGLTERDRTSSRSISYFIPNTNTWNESGSLPRPPAVLGLAPATYNLWVAASRAIVFDPVAVSMVWTTDIVSPATRATVSLPSRHELKASFVPASYHVASVPVQIGT